MIEDIAKRDVNETETMSRVVAVFTDLFGYDRFKHLTHEYAVRGIGGTDHVDLAIQLENGRSARPVILVEVKRIGIDLARKHLKQALNYGIHTGCDWLILTNARQWMLYCIEQTKPPQPNLVLDWDLMKSSSAELERVVRVLSYRSIRKGGLDQLRERLRALDPQRLLGAIICKSALGAIRRELRQSAKVLLPVEDIMAGLRRLLNENALGVLDTIIITLPHGTKPQPDTRRSPPNKVTSAPASAQVTLPMLIEAGLVRVGQVLTATYKGASLSATIQADGSIDLQGTLHDSPSSAGSAAKALVSGRPAATNGWEFWSYRDEHGQERSLKKVRDELKRIAGQRP